jgi:uncharacterized cupredoxin-like copper-binding protein
MISLTARSAGTTATILVALLAFTPAATSVAAGSHPRATRDSVGAQEFSFRLSTRSISKPGQVTFTVKNRGSILHNFKINGKSTPNLQPGKTAHLSVSFKKKGRYRYLCTEPGHAAAGMRGVFTVR